MSKLIFDGPNKLMICNLGVTALDIGIDVYSDWKEWTLIGDNFKYEQAMRSTGGDPLPGSKALGSTYFLLNGWKIRPQESNHTLTIDGNMYCEDGSSPFVPTLGLWSVFVIATVSSLVDSIVQQLPEIEHGMYQNQVCINQAIGIPGTSYPIGTRKSPSNNLTDAKIIAGERGFTELYIVGNFTVDINETINGYTLVGNGVENTITNLVSGCSTSKTVFKDMTVSGRQNGETHYHNCEIRNLSNVHCEFIQCRLIGPLEMHPSAADTSVFHQCYTGDIAGATFIVDLNNSPCHMSFNNFFGKMQFNNMNKATSIITVNMGAGKIIIDSSCVSGQIKVRGSGEVINNSQGTLVDDDTTVNLLVEATSGSSSGLTLQEHNQLMSLNNVDIPALINGIWDKTLPNGVTVQDYITFKLLTTNKYIGLK